MYLYVDPNGYIKTVSPNSTSIANCTEHQLSISADDALKLLGTRISKQNPKKPHELKVALICNWGQPCGISTYSQYLVDALAPKVNEIKIFSEFGCEASSQVTPCWKRGESMRDAVERIKQWNADFVIIQHEFGLFPKATYMLQMMHLLEHIPYAVALHSVYEHLDKAVCTAAMKNIICHSEEGKATLRKTGNNSNVFVVPHGCVPPSESGELWNIFQTPYAIVQFGFGFSYKGVADAIQAVHLLKTSQEKYKDIFYCYLCSENDKTKLVHADYYNSLVKKIEDLGVQDHVAIIRNYHTEETLNHYLRTAKLAIFPYVTDPNNTVYGASGAVRIAMSNGIPVIASKSHLFDDLEGVIPRIQGPEQLAHEMDRVFSDGDYRTRIISDSRKFLIHNSWSHAADKYVDVMMSILYA